MKVLNQVPNCPKCHKQMILRHARNNSSHQFYGCSQFPRCREILPVSGNMVITEKKNLRKIKTPSVLQENISNQVLNGSGNIMVNAGPGSGKSTLLEHITALIMEVQPDAEIIDCMYNRDICDAAIERGMPAKTTHQIGFSAVKDWVGSQGKKVPSDFLNNDKVRDIVMNLINNTWDEEKWMISPVLDIVSKLKNTLAPTDNETISKLCSRFGIEVNDSLERMCDLAREALRISNDNIKYVVDFDDMIYAVWKFKIPVKQYDWILVDESQDLNRAQLELVLKALKPNARCIVVGDRFQSIYGFRGASTDAMDVLKEALNAQEMPLSITYRCAKEHVKLLNQLFPNQPLEAFEGNKEGAIEFCSNDALIGKVQDGDLVLSRVNAALVKPCFALIRQGIKAIIRGRDIGQGLINLIEKFEKRAKDIPHLIELLEDYRQHEVDKLLRANKGSQAEAIQDRVETIAAISDGCYTIREMIVKINEVFQNKKTGVVFSTIHRAKGDEAENVFILRPDLLPHPMAKMDWEVQQELNLIWVGLSRSRNVMTFVGGLPKMASQLEEIEDDTTEEDIVEKSKEMLNEVEQCVRQGEPEKAKEILDEIDILVDPVVDPKALQELIDELEGGLNSIK